MPPKGVKSTKRTRQYENIKRSARSLGERSAKSLGASIKRAKELAARTVNNLRRKAGQTQAQRSRRGGSRKSRSR
ncbi:MAG TPA: hypothetical protein VIW03_12735 [Anaeromyxobacter sp.]